MKKTEIAPILNKAIIDLINATALIFNSTEEELDKVVIVNDEESEKSYIAIKIQNNSLLIFRDGSIVYNPNSVEGIPELLPDGGIIKFDFQPPGKKKKTCHHCRGTGKI